MTVTFLVLSISEWRLKTVIAVDWDINNQTKKKKTSMQNYAKRKKRKCMYSLQSVKLCLQNLVWQICILHAHFVLD